MTLYVHNTTANADSLYYVQTDLLGSWDRIVDGNKNVVQSSHFDPWGNRKSPSNWTLRQDGSAFAFRRGYRFSHWQDSVTDNPRSFVVTQDTVFTAYFEEGSEGITAPEVTTTFTLSPNPTKGEVTVTLPVLGEGTVLTVADASGQEAMRLKVAPDEEGIDLDLKGLPAGAYFVTVVTPQGSHTEKLVIGD